MRTSLFDVEAAEAAWLRLSSRKDSRGQDCPAWDRLSDHMRHYYARKYDGGLLRVIALFGEGILEFPDAAEVWFQPGPVSVTVRANPLSKDPKNRYLLSCLGRILSKDEYLRDFIERRVNALHRSPDPRTSETQFARLHELISREMTQARANHDRKEYRRLTELAGMMNALCFMR